MASDTEITKVRIVIRHLLWQIREVRNDRDAAWKWVNRFANTLQYQDLEQDPDQYALAILAEARSFNDQKKRNGQMKWVREQLAKEGVPSPTQEQLDEKWLEMYGNETTADAPTREDGEFKPDSSNAGDLESATSATINGDAATREAPYESTTVSNNSGNGGSGTSQARESRRTDGHSLRVGNVARPPVRSGRNSRCPNSREEFHAFVADNNLHEGLAEEWYAMHEARGWVDENGNPIKNWRGALYNYCTKTEQKRRTA